MDDSKSKTIVAIGGLIVGVLGLGWGVYKDVGSRNDDRKKPVLGRELEACVNVVHAAADVVQAQGNPRELEKAKLNYQKVFTGELMVTGDVAVVDRARDFAACFNAVSCNQMTRIQFELSNACRVAVSGTVDAVLPKLSPPTIVNVEVR
jgi:hypothetical protein